MSSGARYTDWTHTRAVGDRDAAAPYVPYARKLLGFVMDEAQRNGLGTHKVERTLEDGTRVIAEKHGDIPRVTIITTGGGSKQDQHGEDAFVVWARDIERPEGTDLDHPQQLLRHRDSGWKTYFYSGNIVGYDAFAGDKGTYIGQFPEGVIHAGNLDWEGDRLTRVSWYGPSTRYWFDPFVQPKRQYGTWVFMLGKTLLDTDAYIAASPSDSFGERWVLGAAVRNGYLYTVQALLPDGVTDTTPAPPNSSDTSLPWPQGNVPVVLCRYVIVREDEVTYSVAAGSRSVLWSGTLKNALNPWFFNRSVTAAVTMGLPDVVLVRRYFTGAMTDDPQTMDPPLPSESNEVHTLAVSAGVWGINTTSVSLAPSGQAVVAADFRGDALVQMTARREPHGELTNRFVFEFGGLEIPAREIVLSILDPDPVDGVGTRPAWTGFRAWIMHADLRSSTFLVYRYESYQVLSAAALNRYTERVVLYRAGAQVAEPYVFGPDALLTRDTGFVGELGTVLGYQEQYDAIYAGVALSPLFALYGQTSRYQNVSWTAGGYWWDMSGAHALYSYRAYPPEDTFGCSRVNGSATGVVRIDADTDVASWENTIDDFKGRQSVLSCATKDDITMLSTYGYEHQTGRSINYVDNGDLAALTGFGADMSRYRPIWLLGRPNEMEAA